MKRMTRIAALAALLLAGTASPAAAEPISAAILGIFGVTSTLAIQALTVGLSFAANLGLSLLARARRKNPQFGVRGETVAGEDVPASFTPGGYCSGGKFEYGGEWGEVDGTPNAFTVDVLSFGDLPVAGAIDGFDAFFVNEKPITLDTENPHPTLGYPALEFRVGGTDHLWFKPYDGTQTVADPYLVDKFGGHPDYPYGADQVFRGVPYLICTALLSRDLFKGGFPRYKAVPGSTLLYDLRKDSTAGGAGTHRWDDPATWEPSQNPIVQAYNIVRGIYYGGEWFYGGRDLAAHRIPAAAAMAAMNECDLAVALDEETEEPQFRCAGEIHCDMEPLEALEEILRTCNGRMTSVAGCVYFQVGAPPAADFAINDDDIVIGEGQSFKPFSPLADVINGTSSTYPEPAEAWATTDAPRYLNAEFVAEDGEELVAGITYPFVPFVDQVQRLDITLVADARRERWHEFWLPPLAAATLPSGTLSWTSERNGYVDKKFTIWKKRGRRNRLQLVLLREVDPTDYDPPEGWRQLTTFTPLTRTVVPTQPMTGWGASPAYIEDASGTPRRPSVKVRSAANLHDVRNVHVQLRVKATEAMVFDSAATAYAAPFEWTLNGVFVPATLHQARGKYVPYSGRDTDWSAWIDVLTPNLLIDTIDIFDDAITAAKITDAAVTASKIEDEAITSLKLATEAVTAVKIATGAVLEGKLATNAVTVSKIADNAVTNGKIIDAAITAAKIGTGAVTEVKIDTGAVTTTKIADDSISTPKLQALAITAGKIAANAVEAGKIAANAVGANEIAANSVYASKIVVGDVNNLVPDNKMQEAAAWDYDAGEWDFIRLGDVYGFSGEYVFRHDPPSPTSETYGHRITVKRFGVRENTEYVLGFRHRRYTTGYSKVSGFLRYFDGAGATLGSSSSGLDNEQNTSGLTTVSRTFTAPDNCAFLEFGLDIWLGASNESGALVGDFFCKEKATGEFIVDGAITADHLTAGSVTAAAIAAGTITATEIATGAVTAIKIDTGAVTAVKIAAGTITGDKIAASTIYGSLLVADTITAREMILTDFTNLVQDGSFQSGTLDTLHAVYAGWSVGAQSDRGSAAYTNAPSEYFVKIDGASSAAGPYFNNAKWTDCAAGDEFWISCSAGKSGSSDGANTLRMILYFKLADGSTSANSLYFTSNLGTTWQTITGSYTAPANAAGVRVRLYYNGGASGTICASQITLRRKAGAELIVDGAITADKIAANAITASKIAANAITASKIQAGTITADRIVLNGISYDRLALATLKGFADAALGSTFSPAANNTWETALSVTFTNEGGVTPFIRWVVGLTAGANSTVAARVVRSGNTSNVLDDVSLTAGPSGGFNDYASFTFDNEPSSGSATYLLQCKRIGTGSLNSANTYLGLAWSKR